MAILNVDLSEYDSLRNRANELEEQVKELKKQVEYLKSGSKVIIRTVESYGFKRERLVSESYVGFEDVRLKVEEAMKADVTFSIDRRNAAADAYEKERKYLKETMGKDYEERIQKLKEDNKVFSDCFSTHKRAFEKIEQLSGCVLEDLNWRIFKPSNAIRMVEGISIVAKSGVAGALPYDKDSGLRY